MKLMTYGCRGALLCVLFAALELQAQRSFPGRQGGPGGRAPGGRAHTTVQSDGLKQLVPATQTPPSANRVSIQIEGAQRVIRANSIPNHLTGSFPNRGNPHQIEVRQKTYRLPAEPKQNTTLTPAPMGPVGVAVNGVVFDPGAAEWYLGDRNSEWRYEPLAGAVRLGVDANYAHVQPDGSYHYHGLPTGLLGQLGVNSGQHSPIVGWAADGFPIYALYGYEDPEDPSSPIVKLSSSYAVKSGARPSGEGQPGGTYDGTFVADYEYVAAKAPLDAANGRFTVTPDFPEGTYAYFLTEEWPVIPRLFKGEPSQDFARRGPGGFGGPQRGPGDGQPPRRFPGGGRPQRF